MAQQKQGTRIEIINALAELERIGWPYEPSGSYEVRVKCPVHDDESPSVTLNVQKNLWKCQSAECGAKGDIISLLAHCCKVERTTIFADLLTRYDLDHVKTVNPELIERWHDKIWDAGPLLQQLRDRGLLDEDLRKHRIGYDDGRITIPVYDKQERIINVRKYLPGAPGPEKMKNVKGYSNKDLYPYKQVGYQTLWICGGEMKAIVAGRLLNPHSIGVVTVTAGEGAWDAKLTPLFKDKIVYICMDIDPGGIVAARKVAAQIAPYAMAVYIIKLPLDKEKYKKGDINDYVGREGATDADLLECQRTAERYIPTSGLSEDRDEEINYVRLIESSNPENMGHRICMDALVHAMDTTPYIVPKDVGVSCTKDQPNCHLCPVKVMDPDEVSGKVALTVRGTAAGMLEMVNSPKKSQRSALREALRIPECKVAAFTVRTHYNVIDARLTPQLHIGGDNSDHIVQPSYIVTEDGLSVELNTPYTFTGRVYPHPKNQQAVLLLDHSQPGEDNLSAFKFDEDALKSLRVLQPTTWSLDGLKSKIDELYADIEANVTRIFHRRELHLAIDLTYHSALYFNFDGQQQKGWVNLLVTGDSSQGKSEACLRLMEHYGLGVRHECKNATPAGLLGGLQQLGNRWFVSWGIIPTHDRRLVIMEEIKGTPVETLGKLTDMRSSGVAEISKIEQRKAHARTRLIMISNPRSDRPVSAYNFGIEVIKELVGGLEDVRRFDMAVIMSASQVNPDTINQLSTSRPKIDQTFTNDICRKSVLWAWTRSPDQIRFDVDAVDACLQRATQMCSKFNEAMPLVDRGTMRYKLARLAVALAARTFSHLEDNTEIILVRKCHVDYVANYLIEMYSGSVFGYADFSRAMEFASKVLDTDQVKTEILGTKYPSDLVQHLLYANEINLTDLCDWCELDRELAQKLLTFFVRKHALYRIKRWYVKTSEFISILKDMKEKGVPKKGMDPKEKF